MNKDLYKLMCYKEKINGFISRNNFNEDSKRIFLKFSSLLKRSIYRPVVTTKPVLCTICSMPLNADFIILPCSHRICSRKCLLNYIESNIGDHYSLYNKLRCKCKIPIPKDLIIFLLGGEDSFQALLEIESKKYGPFKTCMICNELMPITSFITLECDHRYCLTCVKQFLETLIDEQKYGKEISCPECAKPVDHHIITANLDRDTVNRYENFLRKTVELGKNEVYLQCIGRPGINCDYAQIVSKDREAYTCPACETSFCAKCKQDVHPMMSCEQKRKVSSVNVDAGIQERINDGSLAMCPWCDAVIEKDPKGCKYITCRSERCRGKRYFCWDCKKKLQKFHESHGCLTAEVEVKSACKIF